MATRTQDEVIIDLITNILRSENKADALPGQVLRDVVVNANASEFERLYDQVETVRIAQSISNANLMTTNQMNNLVANFGIKRKPASKAIGTVTFSTPTVPPGVVRIPEGTKLGTSTASTTSEITFITTFEVRFDPALEGLLYNPDSGNYELQVDVIAEDPGEDGNVGPFTINNTQNSNLPFSVSNNNGTAGGSDQESNNDLAVRALNILLGSNVGTSTGYLGTVSGQDNVLGALIVGPGDPLMTRDGGQGGKVDAWMITSDAGIKELGPSNNPNLTIQNWNWNDQFTKSFTFNFPEKPVSTSAPITVRGTRGPDGEIIDVLLYESRDPAPTGVSYMDPSGTGYHYTVSLADDLETAHSVRADDKIIWSPNEMEYLRTFNASGTAFTGNTLDVSVTYSVDQTVVDVQSVLDAADQHIITADVLAKEAQKILIDVTMDVELEDSFKETTTTEQQTIANVEDAIISEINNTTLGNKIEASDLVQAAHNVEGVDNVILNSLRIIRRRSSLFDTVDQEITDDVSEDNQYFEASDIQVSSVI